jgi:2-C-methyl-D-erythritol 4-phosphate cytidylyltransferase
LIDDGLVTTGLASARTTGAAVAAVPITDTVKSADDQLIVSKTVSRDGLWAAQTPQVFSRAVLADAHHRVSETVTDDAAMVERIGGTVRLFMGSSRNIKITTQDDLPIAEAVLRSRT